MNPANGNESRNYLKGFSERGQFKSKQMATEYLKTIIYWTILGAGLSSFVAWYADKNFIKYKVKQVERRNVRMGLFFVCWAGCLYRGKHFADLKFNIEKKVLFSDESNFYQNEL